MGGEYSIVELAKVIMSEEKLIQLMQEVFNILNPDDWRSLETTLISDNPRTTPNAILSIKPWGGNDYLSPLGGHDTEIQIRNSQGIFEVFSGKLPYLISIRIGEFSIVSKLTKQFLPWGYHFASLKARTSFEHYALTYTELNMAIPDYGWHNPTIHLFSNVPGEKNHSFIAKPILDLLKNKREI